MLTRSELERRALLWRGAGLVVELDGSEYHDPERDTRKTADLMAHGWT